MKKISPFLLFLLLSTIICFGQRKLNLHLEDSTIIKSTWVSTANKGESEYRINHYYDFAIHGEKGMIAWKDHFTKQWSVVVSKENSLELVRMIEEVFNRETELRNQIGRKDSLMKVMLQKMNIGYTTSTNLKSQL